MNIDNLIGNTPLIKINYTINGIAKYTYAKLEYYNYTGSVKDRVAYNIIKSATKNKYLQDNQKIVEATSGNTGISVAAIGALTNHEVHIFMPNTVSKERIELLKLYGAKLHLIKTKINPFMCAINKAKEYAKNENAYYINQFFNKKNIETHYKYTGTEIVKKLNKITGFVSGIGTGGTLMGISKKLKEKNKKLKIIAVEPKQMPLLTNSKIKKRHLIDGIADGFIPELVDRNIIDDIVVIDDKDAINMVKKFAEELGLGIGISSAANFLACAQQHEDGFVTVFADDIKKYISTLTGKINVNNKNFISNDIKLISITDL